MTEHPWRPTRRRLTDTLGAVLAPVVACGLALTGLTWWAVTGNAGSPARIDVSPGWVFLPYGDSRDTAAFFTVSNVGGADDRLVKVTSSAIDGEITLSRHRMAKGAAAYRGEVESATVPAGGKLAMSPSGLDLTLRAEATWEEGDIIPFTLHFERGGRIKTVAAVTRPSDRAF
ncbi:copper chaperone PCu(A)C [Streptomyces bluensis]|uniref:copper chaperone PCu(A)C n=1 Tax=Streptomyces bluensis TaxID=33897 RepID=UPI0033261CD4